MSDERTDVDLGVVQIGWMSPAEVEELGDTVLGHAVRRRRSIEAEGNARGFGVSTSIAAFNDSV